MYVDAYFSTVLQCQVLFLTVWVGSQALRWGGYGILF